MNTPKHSRSVTPSPWLDDTKTNCFRDEFRLIKDLMIDTWLKDMGPYFTPIEPYEWIYKNNGESLFFKGLARLAPMFPVVAYHEQVALWISPPPSGLGNAIYLVMGYDKDKRLRLVGGNYFTEPNLQNGPTLSATAFFEKYDQEDLRGQLELVRKTVEASIKTADARLLLNIRRECEHFHTMAIYITILNDSGSMFHAGKAVIEGVKPADFSYEFFGEFV